MKKFNIMKTVQLILMVLFTGVCVYLIFFKENLYHMIASVPGLRTVSILLWVGLAVTYVFFFLDFSFAAEYKNDYRELKTAALSDPVSGLANRNQCDAIIEKYLDKPLPAGVGCVMFDLTNIRKINEDLGHLGGNMVIRDFSNILKMASVSLCFVGRNGGNKFLAIFEHGTKEKMDSFLKRIDDKVNLYNSVDPHKHIEYKYGLAFDEGDKVNGITDMVALANRRIYGD